MATGRFVAYYRVSTAKQGASGLGLEAQKDAVQTYLNGGRWKIIAEVTEVESGTGKHNDRPKLAEALTLCRIHKATLLIAKLDRLARNVAFISNLMESSVEFTAVDFPQANRLTIHVLAAVAEYEASAISARTKAALAAAKARGVRLGGDRGGVIATQAAKGNQASAVVRIAKAEKRASDLLPVIEQIRKDGAGSLREIAGALNELSIPAARGGEWSAVQVQRILCASAF
jgi:DNA invertase Pin-like site-specific DNA recombinase